MFNVSLRQRKQWEFSYGKEPKCVVGEKVLRSLRSHDLLAVHFLYQTYNRKHKGAVLNADLGMNMQLQVCAFISAISLALAKKHLVLVLTPDCNLTKWHFHLTKHAGFSSVVVTPNLRPEDFEQENKVALILRFSDIKLVDNLTEFSYMSVVIDDFDKIALKLVIRKLHGDFNIGLTERNFYEEPNQKLQWSMLNWCNPGCVGKLHDFYEVDNDNFATFRNNYKHWWIRLSWLFCDTFKKSTDEEIQEYNKTLLKWANENHLEDFVQEKISVKRKRKQKQYNINTQQKSKNKSKKISTDNHDSKKEITSDNLPSSSSWSDSGNDCKTDTTENTDVLEQIIGTSCNEITSKSEVAVPGSSIFLDETVPNQEDDILLSIINNNSQHTNSQSKESIPDSPPLSDDEGQSDVFLSLLTSSSSKSPDYKEKKLLDSSFKAKSMNDTLMSAEEALKKVDKLLNG